MQREIFELIDKIYFRDFSAEKSGEQDENIESESTTNDVSEFELNKLSCMSQNGLQDKELIKSAIKNLHIKLDVVGRKCSDIILQNSRAYSVELKRVSDFKGLLEDSFQICAIARHALSMSEYMFVLPSLKLVKKQVKKSHLIKLYSAVSEIKSFVCDRFLL